MDGGGGNGGRTTVRSGLCQSIGAISLQCCPSIHTGSDALGKHSTAWASTRPIEASIDHRIVFETRLSPHRLNQESCDANKSAVITLLISFVQFTVRMGPASPK